ncbi:TRAP transporter small permease subunit [Polynucleobacter sp. MG-5-Ahmo-C2]|jgi:TRAP-type mannitol/chloroaromatic compound transport system permease small subunit|uniref:TRAP transporter small permease subunit n=1 Tax=unclassified Polynucleobacter TaxID=2640945 RepID=UPI001BFE6E1A|nr:MULTISPECIES: TRAP transporter small permease subunit [unclassified Polynucleobacter]QWD72792.1 TRAP transporter small permease subunit [Polynucleobacter sp. UB-Raua-W9]QWD98892.1 TRAP transporter small permease subunit [Polynucleobacter sp. MG-5-Ahmo-C2]
MDKFMLRVDEISTFVGKAAAWLVVLLMLMVFTDVVRRYAFNSPSAWIGELSVMAYGTLFMMCGAYTLAQNGHVRGDFLYGSMKPRTQATLDLILYITFFLPGIAALVYAGYTYAGESWRIGEHTTQIANGPPLYPFKTIIPIAGAFVLLQGFVEILRCIVCLKTGEWPERLKDAEEIDVIEQQLASSVHVDDEARQLAIKNAKTIDEAAHHRIGQTKEINHE